MNPVLILLLTSIVVGSVVLSRQASSMESATLPTSDAVRFPNVSGANLQRAEYQLPADFEGELNLVMVAFQRGQQRLVNTWLPLARELEAEHEGLAYYELPVVYDGGALARTYLDNVMRAGIPDPKARATTITLYTNVASFVAALDLGTTRNIHVMLVDRAGTVHWRTSGALDAAAERSLRETLAERKGGGGAGAAKVM